MTGALFWSGQSLRDIVPVILLVTWFFSALPMLRMPQLYPMALQSLLFGTEKRFFEEVHTDLSVYWISFTMRGLKALLFLLAALLFLDHYNILVSYSPLAIFFFAIMGFGGLLVSFFFSRLFYSFLGYIYLSEEITEGWKRTYRIVEWLLPIPLSLAVLVLSNTTPSLSGLWLLLGVITIWRILLITKSIAAFRKVSNHYFLLFLYLCSREVVPFVLLVGVVTKYL